MNEKKINLMRELSRCNSILNRMYGEYGDRMNIDNTEACILYSIVTFENVTQRDLVNEYALPKQTVNNIIKRLEANNYIILASNENDKRSKIIKLTEKGIDYSNELLKPIIDNENKACEIFGNDRMNKLIKLFNEFNEVFKKVFMEE